MKLGKLNLKLKHLLFFVSLILLIVTLIYFLQNKKEQKQNYPTPFLSVNSAWADTTLKYLSLEEKIGQLIIYDAGFINMENINLIVSDLHQIMPGGIIFKTDSLSEFIKCQNNIQKKSKINLLTSVKSNTGIPQFEDLKYFPEFRNLLSVKNDSLVKNYIQYIASINKKLNISLNIFPKFKTENDSLFNKDYMKLISYFNQEFKSENILSCINQNSFFAFDSTNFRNNKEIIKTGLSGIVSDVLINNDKKYDLQSGLRGEYNFGGFSIFNLENDKIRPEFLSNLFNSDYDMFITDNPIFLIKTIVSLIENEEISEDKINQITRKVLLAKTWTGVENNIRIEKDSVQSYFDKIQLEIILNSIYKKSITQVKNLNRLIPYKNIQNVKYTHINIGNEKLSELENNLNHYHYVKTYNFNNENENYLEKLSNFKKNSNLIISFNKINLDSEILNAILDNNNSKSMTLLNFSNVQNLEFIDSFENVIQIYNNSESEQRYAADALFGGINIKGKLPVKINDSLFYGKSIETKKVRVSQTLPEEEGINSEVLAKIDSIANDGIRRGAFPGCQIVVLKNGNSIYNKSFGFHTYSKQRRVRNSDLYDLASITKIAATTTAAMRMYDKGKLRLNDKLGKYFRDTKIDYSNIEPDTIFNIDTLRFEDIKDFKKILKYQDTLHLNDSMFVAFDTLIVTATPNNNIFKVKIRDVLLHKSGITPTLPILPYVLYKKNYYDSLELIKQRYYEALKNDTSNNKKDTVFNIKNQLKKIFDEYFTRYYIKDSSETKIANNFYLQNRYFDTLWRDTKRLRVYSRKIYQYSDINMILLQQAIDTINRKSINSYLRNNIYQPMGLNTMCYKPTKYFSKYNIVPTENDRYWREQTLRGNVHDPSAALLGGISGNAGLFSNAYDLALLGQMWLNGGSYGGINYISRNTINKFTGFQEDSHRGLGFDKPGRKSIIGEGAPRESYGHTGFTGTCIWVDPVNDIVFVFLSNRVHPSQKNWKINRLRIRQKIHTVVYDAIINK